MSPQEKVDAMTSGEKLRAIEESVREVRAVSGTARHLYCDRSLLDALHDLIKERRADGTIRVAGSVLRVHCRDDLPPGVFYVTAEPLVV